MPPRDLVSVVVAGAYALAISNHACAAQVYVQPIASITDEFDSNLDYDPTTRRTNLGDLLDASLLMGIATAASDTNLQPRIRYDEYPREPSLNRLEGLLDFNTSYSSPRNKFTMFGEFDHLNVTESEFPDAIYNPLIPVSPTAPQTGQALIGVTSNDAMVAPRYAYNLTPLVQLGVSATAQTLTYSNTYGSDLANFNYYRAEAFLSKASTPRLRWTLGAYADRYTATNITSNADSAGASGEIEYRWSSISSSDVTIEYDNSQIRALQPVAFDGSARTWGASFSQTWTGQTGQFRMNVGRMITPSGGGGLYVNEQVQAEYDRNLSERVQMTAAVLGVRSRGLVSVLADFNRDYARCDLSLKWLMTRTWFLQLGGSYGWQKFTGQFLAASNDQAFLRFGYQGLPPQH